MVFELFILAAALLAGGIAAVTGFAIGSLLTPAIALIVDVVRLPVYLSTYGRDIANLWPLVLGARAGGATAHRQYFSGPQEVMRERQ